MQEKRISNAVVKRLPRYYRYLGMLMKEGKDRISSGELSRIMHVTASQIRQDLNLFGGFGQQGYGYNVAYLREEIARILGLDRTYMMIIVGTGNLGSALASYVRFQDKGMHVTGLFDVAPERVGTKVRDIVVQHVDQLDDFLSVNEVDIAALTLPRQGALDVLPVLARHGVEGIWNFSGIDLPVGEGTVVENVNLSESMMELTYRLGHRTARAARETEVQEGQQEAGTE